MDKLVLIALCHHAHEKTRNAYGRRVKKTSLMRWCSTSKRQTLDAALKRLEDMGWLIIKRQRGRGRTNEYTIPIPRPGELEFQRPYKSVREVDVYREKNRPSDGSQLPLKRTVQRKESVRKRDGPLTDLPIYKTNSRGPGRGDGVRTLADVVGDAVKTSGEQS